MSQRPLRITAVPDVADRSQAEQRATAGLVQLALVHPLLQGVQLRLVHHAVQAQQQSIRMVGGVEDTISIGEQHPIAATEFEQAMPVGVGASQSAHLQTEDQADVIQSHLGEQALKAGSAFDRSTALAEILVDDNDAIASPAE